MPRQPRLDAPGVSHHVTLRGVNKCLIFRDDLDRWDFVLRLGRLLTEEDFVCFAWALMPNHVHMVLRTGSSPLSRLMARLGTGYVVRFNRRHGRVGHLFQNRYGSILVESDEYLRTLVRYVHRNPLRAGLVRSLALLETHPWTGYAALMGRRDCSFLAAGEILDWFGHEPATARAALRRWMRDPDDAREKPKG